MTLTIDLPPELEAQLQAKAQESGQDLQSYALAVLSQIAHINGNQGDKLNLRQQPLVAAQLAALDSLVNFARSLPDHRAATGLSPVDDTRRSADPDIYGYSEREEAQAVIPRDPDSYE